MGGINRHKKAFPSIERKAYLFVNTCSSRCLLYLFSLTGPSLKVNLLKHKYGKVVKFQSTVKGYP
jgi:hypothetical protein